MDTLTTDAYLRRLGVDRPARPDAAALHLAHLLAVPFENLSVHLGEEIRLDGDSLAEKIAVRRRGGFCYELNGAFGALLTALGYRVDFLQARVLDREGRPGIPYDHMTLRVEDVDGGRWLADVGFGAYLHRPLAYDERGEQRDGGGVFRIEAADGGDLVVVRDGVAQYLWEERPRALADFRAGSWWHRTSPDSHFRRSLVCSLLTHGGSGRITSAAAPSRRPAPPWPRTRPPTPPTAANWTPTPRCWRRTGACSASSSPPCRRSPRRRAGRADIREVAGKEGELGARGGCG